MFRYSFIILAILVSSAFAEHDGGKKVPSGNLDSFTPSESFQEILKGEISDETCRRAMTGDMRGFDPRAKGGVFKMLAYSPEKEREIQGVRWATMKKCIAQIARKEAKEHGCQCSK